MFEQSINFFKVVVPTYGERLVLGVGAVIGTYLGLAVGGFDSAFLILCGFILGDFITGTIAAFKAGEWSSRKGYRGLFKKVFILVIVAIGNALDVSLELNFLREACVMAYILNEAGSILENIDRMGFGDVIPPFLRNGLEQIRNQKQAQYGLTGKDVEK